MFVGWLLYCCEVGECCQWVVVDFDYGDVLWDVEVGLVDRSYCLECDFVGVGVDGGWWVSQFE